jgi:RhtB (resistance to homoserine/threonine) family protein
MSFVALLLLNQAEIIMLCMVAFMMAISPGADFVLVTRNSLSCSRSAGIYTTLGITAGTWVHISYCIAGLAVVMKTSPILFDILRYLGAFYLIFIGVSSIKTNSIESKLKHRSYVAIKPTTAFVSGFFSNALNPKTTLFFLGIFTQLVTKDTPVMMQVVYGTIISFMHLLWFSLLSYLLTHQKILPKVKKYQTVVNRLMGAILIAFGLRLILL